MTHGMLRTFWIIMIAFLAAAAAPLPASAIKKNTNAIASIAIIGRIGEPVVFSAPGDNSVPESAAWSCQLTSSGNQYQGTHTVSCMPTTRAPSGVWICPDPYVQASYFGDSANVTTKGYSSCGTATASCQPQLLGLTQNRCEWHAGASGPTPLICTNEYSYATGVQTADWTVFCRTYLS